jgi:hypothetical protein
MIWEIVILILGIPTGYFISWLARDELIQGRIWFKVLIIGSILFGVWFWLIGFLIGVWFMGFLLIFSLVSLRQSFVKGFAKKRFR